jgi:hypothetical protein
VRLSMTIHLFLVSIGFESGRDQVSFSSVVSSLLLLYLVVDLTERYRAI